MAVLFSPISGQPRSPLILYRICSTQIPVKNEMVITVVMSTLDFLKALAAGAEQKIYMAHGRV